MEENRKEPTPQIESRLRRLNIAPQLNTLAV